MDLLTFLPRETNDFILFGLAIFLLLGGTSLFVGGVSQWRMSPFVSGIVILAIGTTLAELIITSIAAGLHIQSLADWEWNIRDIRTDYFIISVIIGSTVANLLLVLPLAKVFSNQYFGIDKVTLNRDAPAVAIAAALVFVFAFIHVEDTAEPNAIDTWESIALIGIALAYIMIAFVMSIGSISKSESLRSAASPINPFVLVLMGLAGIAITSLGIIDHFSSVLDEQFIERFSSAQLTSEEDIEEFEGEAQQVVVKYGIILGFILAIPEIVSVISASLGRKKDDVNVIATGNILSASVMNLTLVLGLAALLCIKIDTWDFVIDINQAIFAPMIAYIVVSAMIVWIFLFTGSSSPHKSKDDGGHLAGFEAFVLILLFFFFVLFVFFTDFLDIGINSFSDVFKIITQGIESSLASPS